MIHQLIYIVIFASFLVYLIIRVKKEKLEFFQNFLNILLVTHMLYVLLPNHIFLQSDIIQHIRTKFGIDESDFVIIDTIVSLSSIPLLLLIVVFNKRHKTEVVEFQISPRTVKIAKFILVFSFFYFFYIYVKYLPPILSTSGFERRVIANKIIGELYWLFSNAGFSSSVVLLLGKKITTVFFILFIVLITLPFTIAGNRFEIMHFYVFAAVLLMSLNVKVDSRSFKSKFILLLIIVVIGYFVVFVPYQRLEDKTTILQIAFGEFYATRMTFDIAFTQMHERVNILYMIEEMAHSIMPRFLKWREPMNVDAVLIEYYTTGIEGMGLASHILNEGLYVFDGGLFIIFIVLFFYYLILWRIYCKTRSVLLYMMALTGVSWIWMFYRQSFMNQALFVLEIFFFTSFWIKGKVIRRQYSGKVV